MLDNFSDPFREYRRRDSLDRFNDVRGILLQQLQAHAMEGLDPALQARVKKAKLRQTYLEVDSVEDEENPLWYAVQFGVSLPPKCTELDGIDVETRSIIAFQEEQVWRRLTGLSLPYRRGAAAILASRAFRSVRDISENVERREGIEAAISYLEEHIEALHELYRGITRGTPREQ